jgi:hypothetical protein
MRDPHSQGLGMASAGKMRFWVVGCGLLKFIIDNADALKYEFPRSEKSKPVQPCIDS